MVASHSPSSLRIALVTETFPPEINGVAMTNDRLARGLAERGHDLEVIRPARRNETVGQIRSGDIRQLPVPGRAFPGYPQLQIGSFCPRRLRGSWMETRPDIVHIATEGPLGMAALMTARKLRIPVTSTFHTNFDLYCRHYHAPFFKTFVRAYLRWFHNRAELTLAPNPVLAQFLTQHGFQRVKVLGRGVDDQLFTPLRRDEQLRKSWNADPSTPVAMVVSRVAKEKNLRLSLRAFRVARRQWASMKMVVVGDGPYLPKLRQEFPDAIFAGARFDKDLAAHYASADMFLFGSVTETFGNVVLEAMASGLVVVTYDYAAGAQFIRDQINGYAAPFDDEAEFLRRTAQAANARHLWPALRNEARRTAEGVPWAPVLDLFNHFLTQAARTP